MLGFGKVTCHLCQGLVRKGHARRGQGGSRAYLCGACYGRWTETGRTCIVCNSSVRGFQDIALFIDKNGLGHADCGGADCFAHKE